MLSLSEANPQFVTGSQLHSSDRKRFTVDLAYRSMHGCVVEEWINIADWLADECVDRCSSLTCAPTRSRSRQQCRASMTFRPSVSTRSSGAHLRCTWSCLDLTAAVSVVRARVIAAMVSSGHMVAA